MAGSVSAAAGAAPRRAWARLRGPARAGLVVAGCGIVGLVIAREPWVAAGAILGSALLIVALTHPLAMIGVMLAFGPIDLRAITGGYKGLFPSLGGLDMNGIRLIGLTISLSAIALVDRAVVREALGRYGRWYLVFLVYAAGTLLLTESLVDGGRLLLKIAYPLLTFVTVAGVVRTRAELEKLAWWMLGGAVLITLVLNPFYVMAGGYEIDFDGRIRIMGVGQHENPFSFYLLTVILFAFTRYSVRGHQRRYLVLAAVCATWMVLTLTRITFLAASAGLVGLALYTAVVERRYRPLLVGAGVMAAIGVALAPTVLERTLGYVATPQELFYFVRHPIQLYEAINWQGRELFWPVIFQAYLSSPLVGLGLGSSTAVMTANFPPEAGLVVHNEYLRLLAETGVVGVGLYAVAVLTWWGGMVRVGRLNEPLVREYALAAAAAILAWSVIAMTDNAFDYYAPFTQYIGFLCAGALVAERITREERAEAAQEPGAPLEEYG